MPARPLPLPNFERRFACLAGCARCCDRPGVVEVTSDDVQRLAAYLDLSPQRIAELFLVRGARPRLRFERGQRCPFLAGTRRYAFCAVQEAKPTQCSTYPFWPGLADNISRWKRETRFCPGIGQGPVVPARLVEIEMRRAMKAGCNL